MYRCGLGVSPRESRKITKRNRGGNDGLENSCACVVLFFFGGGGGGGGLSQFKKYFHLNYITEVL